LYGLENREKKPYCQIPGEEKNMKKKLLFIGLLALVLLSPCPGGAEEDDDREPAVLQLRQPLELEQMEEYKSIPFTAEGFDRIADGMTELEVLSILGKPEDLKKIHRRHGRWSVHYFYPGGYTVNFRNGLVVGKERR
jgi:hypothetical protein